MKKIFFLSIVISFFFSSCATILNSKYQKVEIKTEKNDEILINNEEPKMKDGNYLLARDFGPKQITIKSEGLLDENIVIMQSKKSPLTILSFVPFGVLLYPMIFDGGPKSYDYDGEEIQYNRRDDLEKKSSESKKVQINKIGVELEKENIKYRYFNTYKQYLKKRNTQKATTQSSDSEISIENSIFSVVLNNLLVEKDYIDTTNSVLKNNYLENMLVNATVKDYQINHISSRVSSFFGGMVYVNVGVDWEVLDYYGKPVYKTKTSSRSGEFAILDYSEENVKYVMKTAVKDVMNTAFVEFMQQEKIKALLKDRSQIEEEKMMKMLEINSGSPFVSNVSESINSSVTIRSDKQFGSGFIISEDGYLITNYHVIANEKDFKVILNSEKEYDAKIVRFSKVYDLALLKIDAKDLVPFKLNRTDDVKVTSEVYAVGTPTSEDLSQTVSRGIISGVRKVLDSKLIQTDASVNSGNSGGPLINTRGEVIGVVSSKLKGFGVEGVAFGIPAYEIENRLNIKIK